MTQISFAVLGLGIFFAFMKNYDASMVFVLVAIWCLNFEGLLRR